MGGRADLRSIGDRPLHLLLREDPAAVGPGDLGRRAHADPVGAVGAELINAADGQLLILINTSANTITITETAAAVMAGNFAMGQGDSLTLMGNGVVWYELSRSNN